MIHNSTETTATLSGISPAVAPASAGAKVIIAGPCSAETREQTLATASGLTNAGIDLFRAGLWKPRTRPGGFEGCGEEGIGWLQEVKEKTGLKVATEVASAHHVEAAIKGGIDVIWLGARTTTNPFAVQEIAEAIARFGTEQTGVLVKNPANPDLELWIGAIQRIYNAGIRRISAIHRGFSVYGPSAYRNPPQWHIPIELHRRIPELQLIFDPSHTGGKKELVKPLAREAYELGFDGLIIESHCNPQCALSDAAQQIPPQELAEILATLGTPQQIPPTTRMAELRSRIDCIDSQLLQVLAQRMKLTDEIGKLKMDNGIAVLQPTRYDALMKSRVAEAESLGIDKEFISSLLSSLHAESVRRQLKMRHNYDA